jgi:hypothetical protein
LTTGVVITTLVSEPHAKLNPQRHDQVPRSHAKTNIDTELNLIDPTTDNPLDLFAQLVQKAAMTPATTDTIGGRSNLLPTSSSLVASLQPLMPSLYWTSQSTSSDKPKKFFNACAAIPIGHHNVKRKALFICGNIGASASLTR